MLSCASLAFRFDIISCPVYAVFPCSVWMVVLNLTVTLVGTVVKHLGHVFLTFKGRGGGEKNKTLQPSANEEPQNQYVTTVATLSVMLT